MDKPKFNPNQPFEAVKPKFDPSAPFDTPGAKESSSGEGFLDSANAGLQSFANKASAGHLPELQAAAEYLIPNPNAGLDRELATKGIKVQNKEADFTQRTNQNRAELESLQERNPGSTAIGNVAGILGQGAMISAIAPVNAPTVLGRIAQAARGGALAGVAQNPAEHQQSTEGIQPFQRIEGGFLGAPLGAAAQGLGEGISLVGTKLGAKLAGVSPKAAETYGERGDEVRALMQKHGDVVPSAADEMKIKVLNNVQSTKNDLGDFIEGALMKTDGGAPSQSLEPILSKLDQARSALHPYYDADKISEVDNMIKFIKDSSNDGMVNLRDLKESRDYLGDIAKGSYLKNGQIVAVPDDVKRVAQGGRKVATDLLHKASPEIAYADAVYSDLHDVANQMNKSLLGLGKPEDLFASAGGGKGNANQMMLQKIGDITGTNPLKDAELLYAAKGMKNDSLIEGTRQAALKLGLDAKRLARPLYAPANYGTVSAAVPIIESKMPSKTAIDRRIASERKE